MHWRLKSSTGVQAGLPVRGQKSVDQPSVQQKHLSERILSSESKARHTSLALRLDTNRRVAWNTACGVQAGTSVRNSTSSQFFRFGMICRRGVSQRCQILQCKHHCCWGTGVKHRASSIRRKENKTMNHTALGHRRQAWKPLIQTVHTGAGLRACGRACRVGHLEGLGDLARGVAAEQLPDAAVDGHHLGVQPRRHHLAGVANPAAVTTGGLSS